MSRVKVKVKVIVIASLTLALFITEKVEAGATRSLTQDEINQLKSTGALSEYNTVEGASASAESSSSGSESDHDQSSVETKVKETPSFPTLRKPKCFNFLGGGSSTPEKVPFQTWGIDPRVQEQQGNSDDGSAPTSSPAPYLYPYQSSPPPPRVFYYVIQPKKISSAT